MPQVWDGSYTESKRTKSGWKKCWDEVRMLLKIRVAKNSILKGVVAAVFLLSLYFTIITLISGWDFAQNQFSMFWYFVITLAIGFGIQVGLYSYLRSMIKNVSSKMVATSGATSTVAMISCCSHYLVNILPILGVVGIATVIAQYQIQIFWIGLMFNFAGIIYMANKVYRFSKSV